MKYLFRLSGSIEADSEQDAKDALNNLPIQDVDIEDGPDGEVELNDEEEEEEE